MKVAIYCRLSDEDDNKLSASDESESIQNQKSLLEGYVIANNWEIYGYYVDDDWSGSDYDRPDWNRLLKDAEDKKFSIVLCKSQARFTRDMIAVEKYLHGKFLEWNIRFIGLVDNADTQNKGNKKQRQILGLTNEWYLEDISDNIRVVFDSKRQAGEFIGGFATYGYVKDPEDSDKLVIDEDAADVVRMIYNSYLDEESAINSLSLEIEIDNKIKALEKESNRWESFSYITYENKWCLREKGIILDLIITDTQTK